MLAVCSNMLVVHIWITKSELKPANSKAILYLCSHLPPRTRRTRLHQSRSRCLPPPAQRCCFSRRWCSSYKVSNILCSLKNIRLSPIVLLLGRAVDVEGLVLYKSDQLTQTTLNSYKRQQHVHFLTKMEACLSTQTQKFWHALYLTMHVEPVLI